MLVLEGDSTSGALQQRIIRMEAVLSHAEKYIIAAKEQEARKDLATARLLKRKAYDNARLTSRLIGVLFIEYNLDMSTQIERVRKILTEIKGKKINA